MLGWWEALRRRRTSKLGMPDTLDAIPSIGQADIMLLQLNTVNAV